MEQPTPEKRAASLDAACADNAQLRMRLESLVQAHEHPDSFFNGLGPKAPLHQGANKVQATIDQPATECTGSVIGPYKLLEQIGEGGMGVVFMAEQQQPVRRLVALKLVKPGMDSKQVIARFEAERQALAMMDHSNIAKVHDAGTTETGRPYFVMELVRGIPINDFCDQQKLTVRQRLELFIQVCQAIQHAHQKGIIHRDLKPTNVLVTMNDVLPMPKLIDFGIAKALGQSLTEHTLHTGFAQLVGTPLYMSPEQAQMNQLGVDTRSDVYSLGVLLFELLTGTTPFDKETLSKAGLDEMRRIIREEEPPRPSHRISTLNAQASSTISQQRGLDERHLGRVLRGELDWIVMKALEKDRSRRYESASALAADIQRYLSDEPVLACPPTTMYRFQKFARKHKPALATAAAIALCLILGTTVSAWQAVRATTAEAQANANEVQAKASAQEAKEQARDATAQRDEAQRQRDEVKALNDQLRRTLYASNMNLAKHAWDARNIGRVDELLDQHRPRAGEIDLRGFEWHYLYRLCHSELLTLKGYTVWGSSVAFSPDGKRLVGAARDKTVKAWDAQTGQDIVTFKGHSAEVWSVACSPDGTRLASATAISDGAEKFDATGEVKIWDAQTGKELLTLKGHGHSVAFSPDGKRLASARPELKVWDTQTGQELLVCKGQTGAVNTVAFSPDGTRLASAAHDGTVTMWEASTGRQLFSNKGHSYWAFKVTFSPDGKRLASAGTGGIKVWDAQTGQELQSPKEDTSQVNGLGFSPDGKHLVSGGNARNVRVWDVETGEVVAAFHGHTAIVVAVTFSPDGKRVASASNDGTIKVWDADTRQGVRTLGEPAGAMTGVVFSPDGKRVAFGSATWDDTKKAYVGVKVRVWDAQTGQELRSLPGHTDRVRRVAFSPDGKRLASVSSDQVVKVWDTESGRELLSLKGGGASVAFSPDGRRLASGSGTPVGEGNARTSNVPDEVKVWDAQTGNEVFSLNGDGGVAFSPDSKRLASGGRRQVRVWDAQTGQELLALEGGGGYPFSSIAFSPDGKRLASTYRLPDAGNPGIGEVRVWDAQTGDQLLTLKGHSGHISSVLFSPDGTRLISGDWWNRTVKVWDAQTGQELLDLIRGGGVNNIAISPDGYRLATNASNGVTIWDATPLPEKP